MLSGHSHAPCAPCPRVALGRRLCGRAARLTQAGAVFPQLLCVVELGCNASVDQQEVLLVSDTAH